VGVSEAHGDVLRGALRKDLLLSKMNERCSLGFLCVQCLCAQVTDPLGSTQVKLVNLNNLR